MTAGSNFVEERFDPARFTLAIRSDYAASRPPAQPGGPFKRALGLSLSRPGMQVDWLQPDESEPALTYLPSCLWLIGLGHRGQAYLWGLGLLPYRDPAEVALVLQDIDVITESTESTSILTDAAMVGKKKTRATAAWAEQRGFATPYRSGYARQTLSARRVNRHWQTR